MLDGLRRLWSAMLLEMDTYILESAHTVRVCAHVSPDLLVRERATCEDLHFVDPPIQEEPSLVDRPRGVIRAAPVPELEGGSRMSVDHHTLRGGAGSHHVPIHEDLDPVPAPAGRQMDPGPDGDVETSRSDPTRIQSEPDPVALELGESPADLVTVTVE